jgi:hypothetical protein
MKEKRPLKKGKSVELNNGNEVPAKKSKKQGKSKLENREPHKESAPTNSVQLDSLQSIFSTRNNEDRVFTLFGGDAREEPEESNQPVVVIEEPVTRPSLPAPTQPSKMYFFPHFERPDMNKLSLFGGDDEPFHYSRTE